MQNISLSRSIEQMIHHMMKEPESLFDFDFTKEAAKQPSFSQNIHVRNFHAWLKYDLNITEREIPTIIEKLENGEAILPTYDAILIDEGQDFEPEWFQLVSQLLNPETKSLLLVEDRAQDIYKRKRSYLQDTGLNFQGRSKILSINYRNTAQIVKFAWDFYQKNFSMRNKVVSKEHEGEIIVPQSTRRKGVEPATISTIESSKGLDFQAVFIVNIDNMPFALEEDIEREASLLYIGITRAKEYLCVSYSGESEFSQYFDKILEQRKEGKESAEKSG